MAKNMPHRNFKLEIKHDAKRVFREMLPYINQAIEDGLLDESMAENILVEQILETLEVRAS